MTTMTIRAHFDGKAFIPDGPVPFDVNESVTLQATRDKLPGTDKPSPAEVERYRKGLARLLELAAGHGNPNADCSRDSIYSGTLDDPR